MADISTKRARTRLKPRREPYWQRLEQGKYLGFRRGPDTWIARLRDRAGQQHYQALTGIADFDQAKKSAEKWFQTIGGAPVRRATRGTVRQALESYLQWLKDQGREPTAKVALPKFKLTVWDDPLGALPLHKLTRDDFREWRDRLREGRKPRSVNRIVRDVQAGLNRAVAEGHAGDPRAWKIEPLADDAEESGETAVMLEKHQREALLEAASPAAAAFFRGLEYTGARPGELAGATVADLDAGQGMLRLSHRKGRPARLRVRAVVLSPEACEFFKGHARSKLPGAPLLTDSQGAAWERHEWAREFREARAAANVRKRGRNRIPSEASAYSFRHARISELLQVHGVDPLTVAMQTGTSIRMIERAYFRFIAPALREKLAAVGRA